MTCKNICQEEIKTKGFCENKTNKNRHLNKKNKHLVLLWQWTLHGPGTGHTAFSKLKVYGGLNSAVLNSYLLVLVNVTMLNRLYCSTVGPTSPAPHLLWLVFLKEEIWSRDLMKQTVQKVTWWRQRQRLEGYSYRPKNTKDSWQSADARRQVQNKFPDPPRVSSPPTPLNCDDKFLLL